MMSTFKITPLCLALAACGSGGGAKPAAQTPVAPEVSGVSGYYDGTLSVGSDKLKLQGVITSTGRTGFVSTAEDDAKFFYLGQVSASGAVTSANLTIFKPDSVNGSVIHARAIGSSAFAGSRDVATGNITAASTTGTAATMSLQPVADDRGADLAKLAGTYADLMDNTIVTITADGGLKVTSNATSCTYSGQVGVPDASVAIYTVDGLTGTCTAAADAQLAISGASGLLRLTANELEDELELVAGNTTQAIVLSDLVRTEEPS